MGKKKIKVFTLKFFEFASLDLSACILTLCVLGNFHDFCVVFDCSQNQLEKFFQEYHQGVKQFRFRSGSKLIAKVISRQQKLPLAE